MTNLVSDTNGEKQPEVDYRAKTDSLLRAIKSFGPDDSLRLITALDDFVQDTLDDADAGKIDSEKARSRGGMIRQLRGLDADMSSERNDIDPTTNIPRSGGLRRAFRELLTNPQTSEPLKEVIKEVIRQDDEAIANAEKLRQEAPEDLGEIGLDAVGVEEPIQGDEDAISDASRGAVARINGEMPASPEKAKNPVLVKLFAPPVRPEVPKNEGNKRRYDVLFMSEGPERDALRAQLKAEEALRQPILDAQKKFDRITNQDTREYSVEQLKAVFRHDPELSGMLRLAGFSEPSLDAVDALRTNPELRYAAGEYLLKKLERKVLTSPGDFGDRIVRNGQKRTDYLVLPVDTTSRQYVAYLALAKISGMFNYKVDDSDDFKDLGTDGRFRLNQHRHAAEALL